MLLAGTVGGCAVTPPSPTPTSTPLPPTATVAFPTLVPTQTATPGASATPAPNVDAERGQLLLTDSFDDREVWLVSESQSGGSSVGGGRLSISVRERRAYHFVTRSRDFFGDALVEVDVYTELCEPGDEFGLMFRVNSLGEHYRFVIGCDGAARASRALQDGSRGLTLWVSSPAILPLSPVRNHLALLARGDTFHFFVNDVELFTVRDVTLTSGLLGLMARAGPGGQVSVSFDDLTVYALRPLGPPTATPRPTPIP